MLPPNFSTAIKAAAYYTAVVSCPDSEVNLTNHGMVLEVGKTPTEIPQWNEVVRYKDRRQIKIPNSGLILHVNPNLTFRVEAEPTLAERVDVALGQTGFTPTTKFRWGNARNLRAYRHLFDQSEYGRHLDQLEGAFPKQVEEHIECARAADITKVSQIYLDTKLANEPCLQIPLYGATRTPISNFQRAEKTASYVAMAAIAGTCIYSMLPQGYQGLIQQAVEIYKTYLLEKGVTWTCIVNSGTMGLFYAFGDLLGQYIDGNFANKEFDKRRFGRQTGLGFAYGVECTWAYKAFKHFIQLPNRLAESFVQSFVDANIFGALHFNPRHIHMMEKEKRLTLGDYFVLGDIRAWSKIIKNAAFRGKAAIAAAYSALFWLPFQTWNRNCHTPEEAVGYVSVVVPPFTVFLSLISNEKRQLIEFKQVMERYRQLA